ncbi:unnamed protein product [Dovyalis caffra]|uniref:Uncharacterized protein n=1 Tax=Dovyalis caffra TaxID=77055 RepID=A0AAV1SJL5_9ROSI|nr:unnamed protein product [Dovyalis caffra]
MSEVDDHKYRYYEFNAVNAIHISAINQVRPPATWAEAYRILLSEEFFIEVKRNR